MPNRTLRLGVAMAALVAVSMPRAEGVVISAGTPTTSVPSSLFDSLGSLTSLLPLGEFLLPIEITGAAGLQSWSWSAVCSCWVFSVLSGENGKARSMEGPSGASSALSH